ncbi:oxidoreductase [Stutzerimonas stutzeri]|uniref:proton-conducting transporter transmembrane domain-containing protein n=1 Tax=Stutzerimonas stutzeri TaxID=316 RepID=UPI0024A4D74A|nr:proton-conducting transporter membrane subunit [Stutzerimonas stutzeri]GLZ24120.1 oxidoreductase [Stutzerimonas stutzeri]
MELPISDTSLLALGGVALLLAGEVLALLYMRHLGKLLVLSTLAECGYLALGFGLDSQAGVTGAWMHLGLQLVMRLLVLASAWQLVRKTGSARLDDLAGSAARMPLASLMFGFGLFSVMGLSPFKGSFSKFLVLYAAMEQGHWLLAAIATLASMIAAVYYIVVIQRICLERPRAAAAIHAGENLLAPGYLLMYLLSAATIYLSLLPEPLMRLAEHLAQPSVEGAVPLFETPWRFLVLFPYVSGFALYLLGRVNASLRDAAALLVAAVTLVLAWRSGDLDGLSRLFTLLFAGLLLVAVVYSRGYMRHDDHSGRYYFFLFLMGGSLLGLTSAQDFGNFYLFWELMTWSAYFLVVHERTAEALKGGRIFFLMSVCGAYVMHFGILLAHAELGSFELAVIAAQAAQLSPAAALLIPACLLVGLGVKAGLFPLHAWLPAAHPVAPSSISALMSGVLTKAGVYGILKLLFAVLGVGALSAADGGWATFGLSISVLGCLTLLYGEIMALRERNLKRILAWSTLAQIGEILAIVGLGSYLAFSGALLHVINHAIVKNLLFLAVGALIMRASGKQLDDLRGMGRVMPFTSACFAIGTLAVVGLPPFSGFSSKFLMLYAAAEAGQLAVAALILLGSVLGAIYYLRILRVLLFERRFGDGPVAEAPPSMRIAMGLLAALVILGGSFPDLFIAHLVRPAVGVLAAGSLAPAAIPALNLAWSPAALLAVLGGLATWALGRTRFSRHAGAFAVLVMAMALAAVLGDAGRYDLLSFWFAVLIAGVGLLNVLHAVGYLAHSHAQPRFFFFFVFMIGGLLGLCASDDLYNFFAFWEIMSSWTLYFAIIHDESEEALNEGFKYFIFNFVGASLLFLGVVMLGASAGSFNFAAIAAAPGLSDAWLGGALLLMLAGFLMKSAQLPWRIDYQMHPPTAPTPISGYISAVLLKSGIYGVLKLFTLGGVGLLFARLGAHGELTRVMYGIGIIASITLLYAGAMAMLQNGIKRLLIYSTVSQLGYILLGVALSSPLGIAGGLMHLVNHMLLKDILFLAAGVILAQAHVHSLDQLGGLGRRMPWTFGLFLFAGLSLAGIPPLNGFSSKWLIYQASFQSGHYLFGLAALMSSLFTLAAVLKFAHAAFCGQLRAELAQVREAPPSMLAPMLALAVGSVAIGLFPGLLLVPIDGLLVAFGLEPLGATWSAGLPGGDSWHPFSLSVLLLAFCTLTWLFYRLSNRQSVVSHLYLGGGNDLDPSRTWVPASGLYETPVRFIRALLRAPRKE